MFGEGKGTTHFHANITKFLRPQIGTNCHATFGFVPVWAKC